MLDKVVRGIFGIVGVILIYSTIYSLISSYLMMGRTMMMGGMMSGPTVSIPFYLIQLSWGIIGIILLLIGILPRLFTSYVNQWKKPEWIILRIVLVLMGFFDVIPILTRGMLFGNLLEPAYSVGLFFTGGLFVHVIFEHIFGGVSAIVIGATNILKKLVPIKVKK
ncbi:hypothetical protein [Saccharolobus solfataricus]|uniref:Uncharacterized protein n=1 Tax=Saccharolobus solfataricus TaxID=2287 RepID=A0A157T0S7_SACSO|nr:hypothetical protein [Saccharolobus solfataricus]SAI84859.1 uncharacterised protein [Saccharolobus solfataricus]